LKNDKKYEISQKEMDIKENSLQEQDK